MMLDLKLLETQSVLTCKTSTTRELPKELPLFCCVNVTGGGQQIERKQLKGRGVKNSKRDSSRSPASGEQLTFVDRHYPFHASFVWCVSSCFSSGLYNTKIVFGFGLVLLLLANVLVCLEREKSM